MEFGGLSMLETASKYETIASSKEQNSLTEAPVLVDKSDAEPDGSPKKPGVGEAGTASADDEVGNRLWIQLCSRRFNFVGIRLLFSLGIVVCFLIRGRNILAQ
jgi:hypothetical protein